MKTTAFFLICALLAMATLFAGGSVRAQSANDPLKDVVHEASISIEDCRRIVAHVPGADVAYQPGVDVRGNPVTPAEGPDDVLGQIQLPDEIVIDFGYDFAGAYGIPHTGLEAATADILIINYDRGLGALTVNGKPLKASDARAVKKACEMMLKSAR